MICHKNIQRFQKLDIFRGAALGLMILFHLNYSLTEIFQNNILNFSEVFWDILGKVSAISFILIAGISFSLAEEKYGKDIYKKYWGEILKLFLIALTITLGTKIFLPSQYIVFGIIHFFTLSFVLLLFLRKLRYLNFFIAGIFFSGKYFFPEHTSLSYIFPFGWTQDGFFSADFYPLFPYFGYILLGYCFGLFLRDTKKLSMLGGESKNIFSKTLSFIGKNSLLLYIIHQPIIIAILFIIFKVSQL